MVAEPEAEHVAKSVLMVGVGRVGTGLTVIEVKAEIQLVLIS